MKTLVMKLTLSLSTLAATSSIYANTENLKNHCARRAQEYAKNQEHTVLENLHFQNQSFYEITGISSMMIEQGPLSTTGNFEIYSVKIQISEPDTLQSHKVFYTLQMKRHVQGRSCRVEHEIARVSQHAGY